MIMVSIIHTYVAIIKKIHTYDGGGALRSFHTKEA